MARKPRRQRLEAMSGGSWWDCKVVKKVGQGIYKIHFKNFTDEEDELVNMEHIRCRSRTFSSKTCKHIKKISPGDDCVVFVAHPALQHSRQDAEAWYDAKLVEVNCKGSTSGGKCNCKFQVRLYKMDIVYNYQRSCNKIIRTFRPSLENELVEGSIEVGVEDVCAMSHEDVVLEASDL